MAFSNNKAILIREPQCKASLLWSQVHHNPPPKPPLLPWKPTLVALALRWSPPPVPHHSLQTSWTVHSTSSLCLRKQRSAQPTCSPGKTGTNGVHGNLSWARLPALRNDMIEVLGSSARDSSGKEMGRCGGSGSRRCGSIRLRSTLWSAMRSAAVDSSIWNVGWRRAKGRCL